jgi:hypothetical protein
MKSKALLLSLVAAVSSFLQAQDTLNVSREIAPPGGVAQVKVMLTVPQPISSGRLRLRSSLASSTTGIALFDSSGRSGGVAVIGKDLTVDFGSPSTLLGAVLDYPILSVAVAVPPDAVIGQEFKVSLDELGTTLKDSAGNDVPLEFKDGSITVGGTLNISNVLPGGGARQAGSIIRVLGSGFLEATRARFKDGPPSTAEIINNGEIDFRLGADAQLDGLQVEIRTDTEKARYFSYLRGIADGISSDPLVATVEPVFSAAVINSATIRTADLPGKLYGMAFQNPNDVPVQISISQVLAGGETDTEFSLAPGSKITRAISEWLPSFAPDAADASWIVKISAPIQALGLLKDDLQQIISPLVISPQN